MVKKYCSSCSQDTLHNQRGKKDEAPRCSYCGHPSSTNPAKREQQEVVRKMQVAKLGRKV